MSNAFTLCFSRPLLVALVTCAIAIAQQPTSRTVPFEQAARAAALKSALAQRGGAPFHLRAVISDQQNHDPQWDAEVEEWWASPTLYKRFFHSARFSQTLIVENAKTQELSSGQVFPELLRNLTVELTNPIPRLDELTALHLSVTPPDGTPGQIVTAYQIPTSDGAGVTARMDASVAIDRQTGLMVYGGNLDWDVALHDFAPFHGLQVPQRLTAQTQGGPRLTAQITLLKDLTPADVRLIRVTRPTPASQQLRVAVVAEPELRKLALDTPAPQWPDMAEGALAGTMTMRVVVDRTGKVRSLDNFFSNNPGFQESAEKQLSNWRFRPYLDHGTPVQVISTLTFSYKVGRASH